MKEKLLKNKIQYLMQIKASLLDILNRKQYEQIDQEQIEYLINVVDCFLTQKVKLNKECLHLFMEEIVTTAIHQLNFDFLDLLRIGVNLEEFCVSKV